MNLSYDKCPIFLTNHVEDLQVAVTYAIWDRGKETEEGLSDRVGPT